MIVIQCWDDGVASDAKLADICRKYGAKATFNLNAGLHQQDRKLISKNNDREIWRLGWNEMNEVYSGFLIANHGLCHPKLEQIPIEDAIYDIQEGRKRLQQFFQQPICGLAYPYGTYNAAVMEAVREAGHVYARTVKNVDRPFPPEDPMAFHVSCHFLDTNFWLKYKNAKQHGYFYFWGHSYEIVGDAMWRDIEEKIARISNDAGVRWMNIPDLFLKQPEI